MKFIDKTSKLCIILILSLTTIVHVMANKQSAEYGMWDSLPAGIEFWGMTEEGGEYDFGTIISYDLVDNTFRLRHEFQNFTPGVGPIGDLIEYNGKYYGMTPSGGSDGSGSYAGFSGGGVIFSYDPATSEYSVLTEFDDWEGSQPQGKLVEFGGIFYGTTLRGGANLDGLLFKYNPGIDSLTVIHDFNKNTTGRDPYGSPILVGDVLYGMTRDGGSEDDGVIYEYDISGEDFDVLYNFENGTGIHPEGDFLHMNGYLYGMTSGGGAHSEGVVFKYHIASDNYTVIHEFDDAGGSSPLGSLVESGGLLYGLTSGGGDNSVGVLFEYDSSTNNYTVLHHFSSTTGEEPQGQITEKDGKLYGLASDGGNGNDGTLFEYDPVGDNFSVLVHFDGPGNQEPFGSLMLFNDKFYGTTKEGGIDDVGTIFEYDPVADSLRNLAEFQDNRGKYPFGSLTKFAGLYYGLTNTGGLADDGVLFAYDAATDSLIIKYNFDQFVDGARSQSTLVTSDSMMYGMCSVGGTFNNGTLFKYDPLADTLIVLHHFDQNSDGSRPPGDVLVFNNKLYGMTNMGPGPFGNGIIFEYDLSTGTFSVLYEFDDGEGEAPFGSLIEKDGKLYGMTSDQGTFDDGLIFEYDPGGDIYTVLHHFNENEDGEEPRGSLIEYDGKFYGMTRLGVGAFSGSGVIFEYDPAADSLKVLHEFPGIFGNPLGDLTECGGKFYGFTSNGGDNVDGEIFQYDPATDDYQILHTFDEFINGELPIGNLIVVERPSLIVTNTNNSGTGSLRQALMNATAGDSIRFDPAVYNQDILIETPLINVNKEVYLVADFSNNIGISNLAADNDQILMEITDLVGIKGLTLTGSGSGEFIVKVGTGGSLILKDAEVLEGVIVSKQ